MSHRAEQKTSGVKGRQLVWFKSDLRVYDNPALLAAMSEGVVAGVFCVNQDQWRSHDMAPIRQEFMLAHVVALSKSLEALNVPLIILRTERFSQVPSALTTLALQLGATHVFANQDYELNERACLQKVKLSLKAHNIAVKTFDDQCLIQPGRVVTNDGGPYKVFSAFKRKFFSEFDNCVRPLFDAPSPQPSGAVAVPNEYQQAWLDLVEEVEGFPCSQAGYHWPIGEEEAHDRLNSFIERRVARYHELRDLPEMDQTSGVSPYLAVGALSTRQCLQAAMIENQGRLSTGKNGVVSWINELIWREFYRHILFFFPHLCKGEPFKAETSHIDWRGQDEAFDRWCRGETGFPLVDAAMKQLLETGWMHNRLRMVTAMFLAKDLMVDWRLGEAFFMQHLIDGDFASNNGGWQWSASTGCDSVPYFRVFNPFRQSERFDPEGHFIRRYLPALKNLDAKSIHKPSPAQLKATGYSAPMVDHGEAVTRVKMAFSSLSEKGELAQNDKWAEGSVQKTA